LSSEEFRLLIGSNGDDGLRVILKPKPSSGRETI
jgi:hypothetical protein